MILAALALQALPLGGSLPAQFIGRYAADGIPCERAVPFILTEDAVDWLGRKFHIAMVETIDENSVHVWLHGDGTGEIRQYHIQKYSDPDRILISDERAMVEAYYRYDEAVPDSGSMGLYLRCAN